MKLKHVKELPKGKSYHNKFIGCFDFDNGKLGFITDGICEELTKKETKALFTSMLMHYMANGDTDLFDKD